jgi:DNA-binding GntR family transcriptional regulator
VIEINKNDLTEKLNENPFKSITDALYEILLYEIINFLLPPETALIESYIAEFFNISRSPVREAIQLLEKEGYVVRNYKKPAIVSPFNANDYFNLNNFRYIIEPAAAGCAAMRITDKEIATLEDYAKQIENAYTFGTCKDMLLSEDKFHEFIIFCSKNKYLIDAYETIKSQINKCRIYITADKNTYDFIIKEHYIIFDSIMFKNKDTAESACRRHIAFVVGKSENEVKETCSLLIQERLRQINQYLPNGKGDENKQKRFNS